MPGVGFTYKCSDAITLVGNLAKGMPLTGINTQICDMVLSDIYSAYPWRWSVVTIASGTIPLSDGVQDYSPPPGIYRLLRARIVRTDVTPNTYQDISVEDDLVPDLTPTSYTAIRSISHQQAVGQLRLESAVQVSAGVLLEIQGEYQIMPPKITALAQDLFLPDQYFSVFVAGLLYWVYRLADDGRAGSMMAARGRQIAVGQYAEFQAAIQHMKESEDYGADEQMFPERSLGEGRFTGNLSIYGI